MKLIIDSTTLGRALTKIRGIVEARNTIPILSHVLLRAEGDHVVFQATDLDLEITEKVMAKVDEAGAVAVPAHLFGDIAKKVAAGIDVNIDVAETVKIKAGRSRFTLHHLPASDFPSLTAGDFPSSFIMKKKELKGLLDQTQFAISTEETRYYLNGIYFHTIVIGNRRVIRSVATDGHRLAQAQITAPDGMKDFRGIILPRKCVAELQKLLEKSDDDVGVELSDTKARFTIGDIVLTSKLIDGTFPDYERVIPKANDKFLTLNKGQFRVAVDRTATVSSERGKAVKLSLEKAKLTLSVNNPDSGTSTEDLDAGYESEPLEIGFNSRYLLDLASHLGEGELEMVLADAGSPTLVRTKGELDTLFVLMPMRV